MMNEVSDNEVTDNDAGNGRASTGASTGAGAGPDPGSSSGSGSGAGGVRQARTREGAAIDAGFARELSVLARQLQAEPDQQAMMQRIVDAAVAAIPGADAAAITLVQHGQVSSPVHSSTLAAQLGAAQQQTGQGPCVDTSRQQVTIRVDDLRGETRWPRFTPIAVHCGVLSVLSFPLFVQAENIGALDVYGQTAAAFDDKAETIGLLLASHAAIAMSANAKASNLHAALQSRDLIGQAKGILMERYKLTGPQAFDLLVTTSQHTHRKLHDLADDLTATGELPALTEPGHGADRAPAPSQPIPD